MECIDAQRIISEALDKVAVDDVSVEKAKLHCTGCAECNGFVRAIATTLRTGLPPAPDDLPDRIMTAVRAEAQSRAIAEATAAARAAASASVAPESTVDATDTNPAAEKRTVVDLHDRATRRSLMSWAAAAAVVLIAAGVFANQGVRQILRPSDASLTSTRIGGATGQESAMMAPSQAAPTTSTTQDATALSTAPVAYPGDYIVVSGFAYLRATSAPDIARETLEVVGAATTALDAKGTIRTVEVLAGDDRSRLYVERQDGTILAFDRVTREYQGQQYALQSGPIDTFGTWPSYPAGVAKPSTPAGDGPFKELPADTTGARLFEPAAGGARVGIAVAPGTPVTDPARGNPDWTWWAPVR